MPTWSNHRQVFSSLGFSCHSFTYYDSTKKGIDWNACMEALRGAQPGTVVILHACAHNPTGLDPNQEQWKAIGHIVRERGLFPLFDAAYLGFNSGNIENDAFAIRHFVELGIEVGVCLSFAKNMGLYGRFCFKSHLLVNTHTDTQQESALVLFLWFRRTRTLPQSYSHNLRCCSAPRSRILPHTVPKSSLPF